jgi:hypothetical protein
MAVHDNDRRTARDYMRDARTRYDGANSATRWGGALLALVLLAFIIYMFVTASGPNPNSTVFDGRTTPSAPTTGPATAPTTQPK